MTHDAVFQVSAANGFQLDDGTVTAPGWYWLSDGEPVGPFATETATLADAQELDG